MDDVAQRQLKQFELAKQQCLSREDLSRKGTIDEPIRCLVELLNSSRSYYTTSTCSGRILLIEKPHDNPAIKKGGNFVLNSHQEVQFDAFHDLIREFAARSNDDTCLWLKFEPFIMHVQCIDLEKARSLVGLAIQSGRRNSGITIGRKESKFLVAVRSTSSMEVPLHCGSKFTLDVNYLRFLNEECNRRLRENLVKLDDFTRGLKVALEAGGDIK